MVSVPEATSIILAHLFSPGREKVSLRDANGRVLATSIHADRDLPPFDRVTMDGVAIRSDDITNGKKVFNIVGTQAAGQEAMIVNESGTCIEVMTGAVLPQGTDTVVKYEDIEIREKTARIKTDHVPKGESIHIRGADARKNELLLSPGRKISPAEIALMSSVGVSTVDVSSLPRTAIISTGDELVPMDHFPRPHQIRISNAHALQSALLTLNCPANLFHIRDDKDSLHDNLSAILRDHDLIILSGGVSKGKFDFVPEALTTLGIGRLFHQVQQRPGKPLWFGRDDNHFVFALPGNPVSTFLCFYRYVKPWLEKSLGIGREFRKAILAKDFSFHLPLTYFLEVGLAEENVKTLAIPNQGGGSGDFANLKDADGFLELPAERNDFKAGEIFSFIPFRNQ